MIDSSISLQEKYAPNGICFGCGCENKKGLQIKSYLENDLIVGSWNPQKHHEAFPGVLNGGIIGSLLDCHSNWAAAYHIMLSQKLKETPCTVTAEYSVKLKRPTPTNNSLSIVAKLSKIDGNKAWIDSHIIAEDKICATASGIWKILNRRL